SSPRACGGAGMVSRVNRGTAYAENGEQERANADAEKRPTFPKCGGLAGSREYLLRRHPAAPDQIGIVRDRLRPADEIALDLVTRFAGEKLELFGGLHALRHHRQIEPAPESDHRAHDGDGLLAVRKIGDEGPVDLDLVEWERLQIGQRRIA